MLLLSSIGPVIAVDSAPISIEDFNIELVSGAEQTDAGWVYTASAQESLNIHRFLYRVNYATSGIGELAKGAVVITLPKEVFTDRKGNPATHYDVAVPEKSEVEDDNTEVKFVYEVNGNGIRVYNRIAIETAQNGYIEIAYIPTKSSFDFIDMQKHADINSSITVTHEGETRTAEAVADGVKINTGAQISKSIKCDSPAFYGAWQDSWGLDKPNNADDYYYLTWLINTSLTNVTQYYDFTLDDTFNEVGGEIVAYKFQNQTRYTDSNTVLKQRSSERHDYVLTKHLKSQYSSLNEYTLHNSVTVTVTPCDGVDSPTSADSTAQFVDGKPTGTDDYGALWDKIPVLFQSAKYGLTTSDYLSEFKRGDLERIDGLEFYSRTGGYFDLFASGFGAGNPAFANKGEMVYSVYDNQLYLNATEADVINGTATPLEYSDYDIKSVKVSASLYDGIYVENIGHYTTDNSKPIDRPVQIFAYVSGEYVRIADYSPVTK